MAYTPESIIETSGAEYIYFPEVDKAQTECGVFAIYSPEVSDVADSALKAARTLQHRGQVSAGITVSTGYGIAGLKDVGIVKDVIEPHIKILPKARIAMSHTRYATSQNKKLPKERLLRAAMPIVKSAEGFEEYDIALAGNFNFKFARDVAGELGYDYDSFASDGDFAAQLLFDTYREIGDIEKAVFEVFSLFKDDAFCMTIMTKDKLIAIQDPRGMKPFSYAQLEDGSWTVSSESAAQSRLKATLEDIKEFTPGYMMVIDENGMRQERVFDSMTRQLCLLEYIYFSRPDAKMLGIGVYKARHAAGQALASVLPVEVDFVSGVPESGLAAAHGYSYAAGLPYFDVIAKNRHTGRTFIQETQEKRDDGVEDKLLPIPDNAGDAAFVLVEDSIIRGTTSRQTVAMLRRAGAREIHKRVASPRAINPCFYGVDMKTRAELIANKYKTDEALARHLGVESLAFLDIERMLGSVGKEVGSLLCHACFGGPYPTEVPVDLIPRN